MLCYHLTKELLDTFKHEGSNTRKQFHKHWTRPSELFSPKHGNQCFDSEFLTSISQWLKWPLFVRINLKWQKAIVPVQYKLHSWFTSGEWKQSIATKTCNTPAFYQYAVKWLLHMVCNWIFINGFSPVWFISRYQTVQCSVVLIILTRLIHLYLFLC